MEIQEYLDFKEISREEFAKKIPMSKGYLDQLIVGIRTPGKHLAKKIFEAADGYIEFEKILYGPKKK